MYKSILLICIFSFAIIQNGYNQQSQEINTLTKMLDIPV